MPWQGGARSEHSQMCQLCPVQDSLSLQAAVGHSATPVCGSMGTARMAQGLVSGYCWQHGTSVNTERMPAHPATALTSSNT